MPGEDFRPSSSSFRAGSSRTIIRSGLSTNVTLPGSPVNNHATHAGWRSFDGHALAFQVDAADKDSYGLLPPQAGERQDHRDIAEALLEPVERLGEPQHLGNAGDDDATTHRPSPARAQLKSRIKENDPLLPRPCE
jgi:hypothetical protein